MISILCPCFNEEKSLPLFFDRIIPVMENTGEEFEFVFANDGSTDNTLSVLKNYVAQDKRVRVIDFSRNFGKEAAITALLDYSHGDAVVLLDADLQHPPELIPEMIQKWHEGWEVVAARRDRDTDSFLKKYTALAFYRFSNYMMSCKIPANVGDFRLMDRCVVDTLIKFRESQRLMKGLFAWAGFNTYFIDYKVEKRAAGESKFRILSLLHLAVDGITSFSTLPLKIWSYIGGIVAFGAFIYGLGIAADTWIFGKDTPGYATTVCLILLFGGLQLLGIGVMGEYLGRTYIESKNRPIYIVRKVFENE